MAYVYKTKGTCSRSITVDLDGKTIKSVTFEGGCNGNTQGISELVVGMNIDDVIGRVKGTTCGPRPTSCPDQLAHALEEAYAAEQEAAQ
ncbi:MAG: TIGR03905 family TSCPD domain-containing protein [Selenomonadaceae bacterium]|nr:TIGR03905 family TSCPD domain-containing protein [Selenomonadaceae bacterium]